MFPRGFVGCVPIKGPSVVCHNCTAGRILNRAEERLIDTVAGNCTFAFRCNERRPVRCTGEGAAHSFLVVGVEDVQDGPFAVDENTSEFICLKYANFRRSSIDIFGVGSAAGNRHRDRDGDRKSGQAGK